MGKIPSVGGEGGKLRARSSGRSRSLYRSRSRVTRSLLPIEPRRDLRKGENEKENDERERGGGEDLRVVRARPRISAPPRNRINPLPSRSALLEWPIPERRDRWYDGQILIDLGENYFPFLHHHPRLRLWRTLGLAGAKQVHACYGYVARLGGCRLCAGNNGLRCAGPF